MTINKAILVGRLGQDPDLRTANSGTSICSLSVATTHDAKKGEVWEKVTTWHRVTIFGKTAENAAKYLAKGREVYIEGRIEYQKWTDKDGNQRDSTQVIADQVRFLGDKPQQDRQQDRQQGRQDRGGYGGYGR